jgi:hypothetical protein
VRPAEPLTRYDAALARLARLGRCLAVISQRLLTSSSGLLVRSAVPGAVHSAVATALPTLGESFAALETHGPTLGPNPRLVSPHWQLDPVRHAAKPVGSSTSPLTSNPGTNEDSNRFQTSMGLPTASDGCRDSLLQPWHPPPAPCPRHQSASVGRHGFVLSVGPRALLMGNGPPSVGSVTPGSHRQRGQELPTAKDSPRFAPTVAERPGQPGTPHCAACHLPARPGHAPRRCARVRGHPARAHCDRSRQSGRARADRGRACESPARLPSPGFGDLRKPRALQHKTPRSGATAHNSTM